MRNLLAVMCAALLLPSISTELSVDSSCVLERNISIVRSELPLTPTF